uniref:Uncharacterized protein n=1 Tax=Onchocerca volvulus TaxID=6282 RepID=A0A8R1XMP7_ONCVO
MKKEEQIWWQRFMMADSDKWRKELCRLKCDENFLLGLDMVKVFDDENDLKLFCRLNDQHDRCLRDCGFNGQKVNMHNYICKHHYQKLAYLLPCYKYAVPVLRRECRTKRCGPHTFDKIDNAIIGYEYRCHLLICDIKCTTNVLIRSCAGNYGQQAAHFIMNYTSTQVSFWMEDLTKKLYLTKNYLERMSPSCSKLLCQQSDLRRCFL